MPIKRCTLPGGGSGFKYGDSGKCYASKKDALRQMRAIKVNESKGFINSMANALDPELALLNALAEVDLTDEELNMALDGGHGTYNYSCGHLKTCSCYHFNMEFYVQCFCPDCRE